MTLHPVAGVSRGRRLRHELENVLGFLGEAPPRQFGVLVVLVRGAEVAQAERDVTQAPTPPVHAHPGGIDVVGGELGVTLNLTAVSVGYHPQVSFWQREADGVPVDQVKLARGAQDVVRMWLTVGDDGRPTPSGLAHKVIETP